MYLKAVPAGIFNCYARMMPKSPCYLDTTEIIVKKMGVLLAENVSMSVV